MKGLIAVAFSGVIGLAAKRESGAKACWYQACVYMVLSCILFKFDYLQGQCKSVRSELDAFLDKIKN